MDGAPKPPRGSADLWVEAGLDALAEGGIEAVRLGALSARLGLSRTSFYGHFASREALLAALLDRWRARTTAGILARSAAYAETVAEALLNLFDCWFDPGLFDPGLDRAVRGWALADRVAREALEAADRERIAAIVALFARFGFAAPQAEVRACAVYYTQVGYVAMGVEEDRALRLDRIPAYVETFSGTAPTASEMARFRARHAA